MDAIFDGIVEGLKICKRLDRVPLTMGIDTWGVDYVLLDEQDRMMGDSVAYRDSRTEGMDALPEKTLPLESHYAISGIAAAYDFDGFLFFPGCFPNDWLDTPENEGQNGRTGILDVRGEPTEYYPGIQQVVAHFQAMAQYIHGARWLGVETLGEFDGGFGEVTPQMVEWGHCIYQGGLPENEKHRYSGKLPEIQAEKQLFVGVFENGTQTCLLLVNNSITAQNCIRLPKAAVHQILQEGSCREYAGEVLDLEPGESVLAILA